MNPESSRRSPSPASSGKRRMSLLLGAVALVALALLGVKTYRIYGLALQVKQDVQSLEASLHGDSMSEAFLQSGDVLQDLNSDLGQSPVSRRTRRLFRNEILPA